MDILRWYGHGPVVVLTDAQLAAIRQLDAAVAGALKRAYDRGRARGANALRRLADGEITVAQFDACRGDDAS
jgi:hypothetical protein